MSSLILSRSALRDTQNRLRILIKECGGDELEEVISEDISLAGRFKKFMNITKQLEDDIIEKTNRKKTQKSNDATANAEMNVRIQNHFQSLKMIVSNLENVKENENKKIIEMNKENMINFLIDKINTSSKEERIKIHDDNIKNIASVITTCNITIEKMRALNVNDTEYDSHMKKQNNIEKKMKKKTLKDVLNKENNGSEQNIDAEDQQKFDEKKNILKNKKKEQDALLDMVQSSLASIVDKATLINRELDIQLKMLEDLEDKGDTAITDLKSVNRKLNNVIKSQQPINVILKVLMVIFILAIVGYIIYQYGLIQ